MASRSETTNPLSFGILGTGSAVPAQVVTNAQLATMVATDPGRRLYAEHKHGINCA